MKNLKTNLAFAVSVIALGVLALVACEKEVNQEQQELEENVELRLPEHDTPVSANGGGPPVWTWSGWGTNLTIPDPMGEETPDPDVCDEYGLCHLQFKISGGEDEPEHSEITMDDAGAYFSDIFLDDMVPLDVDVSVLPIIETISEFNPEDGLTYTLLAGDYPLDPTMGDLGGYRLPIIVE